MDATCCIDLSSSSESEIDDTVVHSSGGRHVLTKSRILPSWATGNTSQTAHIGNNKYVPESNKYLLIDDGVDDPSCINSKVSISQPAKSSSCNPSFLSTSKSLTGKSSNSSHFNKTGIFYDYDRSDKYAHQYFKKEDHGGTSTTCNNSGRVLPPSLVNTKYNGHEKLEYDPSIKYGHQHFEMKDHGRASTVWNSIGRVLPPTMGHINYNGETSAANFNREGDEGTPAEHDERLVYRAALQDLCQPKVEVDLPSGLLNVSLFRHQKIALAWMLQKETKSLHCSGGILADDQGLGKTISTIALILMQKFLLLKRRSKNKCNQNSDPKVFEVDESRDSVLDEVNRIGESDDVGLLFEHKISSIAFRSNKSTAGTLVVCPATVLQQWASELDSLVTNRAKLSVCVYHGGNRKKDVCELSDYDVVLTTYSIVANEVPKHPLGDDYDDLSDVEDQESNLFSEFSTDKKQKKKIKDTKKGKKKSKGSDKYSFGQSSAGLGRVRWARVVLDEAQTIKNHRTQVAKACCGLRAKRRWCLSGTPIQNSIDDLFSYFQFLRYDPYASYKSFYNAIKIPIIRDMDRGYMKLQAILRAVMLRRTKDTKIDGKPIVLLPPKIIKTMAVSFSHVEKSFYMMLEAETRSKFKAYADAGTLKKNYANILLLLLRLRQACDHPFLVKEFNFHRLEKVSIEMARSLPRDMLINLLDLLDSSAICYVCHDLPEDSVVTMCGHVFCYQCVSEYLRDDDNICPAKGCREQLGEDIVFSKPTIESCLDVSCQKTSFNDSHIPVDYPYILNDNSSSKIRAALEILQLHCLSKGLDTDNQSEQHHYPSSAACTLPENMGSFSGTEVGKAIIFSQWTGMLDLVELSLKQYCISFRRLDGSMNLALRDKAVNEFNKDPEVVVMLMSLKAGNLGLNMVAACHVILLDPWWNPTSEDQAIDRAHRIGQCRPVSVTRITIKDTVEDKILCLQEKKRKVVASAFGENNSGRFTHLTEQELRFLFGF